MWSSLDYAGFAQLCGRSAIMRKIMRAHNRIIPRSLDYSISYNRVASHSWCQSVVNSLNYRITVVYILDTNITGFP